MCSGFDLEDRDPRSPRMIRCDVIDATGRAHSFVLRNISRYGLGGSHCSTLEAGQHVEIVLPEGTLTGRVRWSAGGKFGILLDDEIVPENIKFVAPKSDAAPHFKVSVIHQVATDSRRPGF